MLSTSTVSSNNDSQRYNMEAKKMEFIISLKKKMDLPAAALSEVVKQCDGGNLERVVCHLDYFVGGGIQN